MKNVQSLQNWQFQSPNFHKMTKLVPGYSKYRKLSPKVLSQSQVVIFCPLVKNWKSFGKLQVQSLYFQILAELVPGGIFLDEKLFLVLGSLKIFNMNPWIKVFHKMARMVH